MIYQKNKYTLYNDGLRLDLDQFFLPDHDGNQVCGSNGIYVEYIHYFNDLPENHRIEVHDYRDEKQYFLIIHNVYVECGDLVGVRSALLSYLESAFPTLYKKYLKLENGE